MAGDRRSPSVASKPQVVASRFNSAAHPDARQASCFINHECSRAGGRGRWAVSRVLTEGVIRYG